MSNRPDTLEVWLLLFECVEGLHEHRPVFGLQFCGIYTILTASASIEGHPLHSNEAIRPDSLTVRTWVSYSKDMSEHSSYTPIRLTQVIPRSEFDSQSRQEQFALGASGVD